jgi:YkoY family integral membrane protein
MLDQLVDLPDQFGLQSLLLLPVLIALETVLSADNAIALAAIAQGLKDPKLEKRALDIGLVCAYVLRMLLIFTATWVVQFWQFELAGAFYLLWLVFQHFMGAAETETVDYVTEVNSLWRIIPVLAFTDLAFSLDSVTTAIAVTQDTWLIVLGGTIGVVALRFMARLFIRWLDEYQHLADAGYVTVALVGIRLLLKVIDDSLVPPEWIMLPVIILIFIWGFSESKPPNFPIEPEVMIETTPEEQAEKMGQPQPK